jgi:rhodanese-related sulfurtransferase
MTTRLVITLCVSLFIASAGVSLAGGTNATASVTHVTPQQANKLIQQGGVTILDLRTPVEFSGGHIAGATNLNCSAKDFPSQLTGLDRQGTYLIHCASGRRSSNALGEFRKLGFAKVIHLDGGLKAWESEKLPVIKD